MQEMDGLSSPCDSRAVAVGSEVFASGLWFGEWLKSHGFWQKQMAISRDEIFLSLRWNDLAFNNTADQR